MCVKLPPNVQPPRNHGTTPSKRMSAARKRIEPVQSNGSIDCHEPLEPEGRFERTIMTNRCVGITANAISVMSMMNVISRLMKPGVVVGVISATRAGIRRSESMASANPISAPIVFHRRSSTSNRR